MRPIQRLLLLIGLTLLPACRTPVLLYATHQASMREDSAPRLTVFEGGEPPAIVVDLPQGSGWGEAIGTVLVDDALTGRTAWRQSQFMKEGYTHYFLPQNLPRGTFLVTLTCEDDTKAILTFEVR